MVVERKNAPRPSLPPSHKRSEEVASAGLALLEAQFVKRGGIGVGMAFAPLECSPIRAKSRRLTRPSQPTS